MDKNKNEELQSRREFFKSAAKAALPVLGVVMLSHIVVPAKASEVTGCNGGCYYSCYGNCKGYCDGTCSSCNGRCASDCQNSCLGGCDRTCGGGCTSMNYY